METALASREKIPDEHQSEMREPETPTGDEIGNQNDNDRPRRANPRIDEGCSGNARENGRAKTFERRVHGGERTQEDQDVDGV